MKHFYYVYNRSCEKPVYRHGTLESAVVEAIRLAEQEHKNYYVLESVAKIVYNHDDSSTTYEGRQLEMKEQKLND